MCTENNVLVQNMFTNGLNMGMPWRATSEKTVHGAETHWHNGKEKVLGTTNQ